MSRDERQFELRVLPRGETGYGLSLHQTPPGAVNGMAAFHKVVQVWGTPLKATMDRVLPTLRRGGYRTSDLGRSRRAPFCLAEEDGVRLGLLFLSVKPLRRLDRIEAISEKVSGMEPEELYYWYSKTTAQDLGHRRRALRALRILMAEE